MVQTCNNGDFQNMLLAKTAHGACRTTLQWTSFSLSLGLWGARAWIGSDGAKLSWLGAWQFREQRHSTIAVEYKSHCWKAK